MESKTSGASSYSVDPFRNPKDIIAIKNLLKDNPRDMLLFILGINTWLPVSALLSLRIKDVRGLEPGDSVRIKGEPQEELFINKTIHCALQEYLRHLPENSREKDFLFSSRKGGHALTANSVTGMVKGWASRLKIKGTFGAQSLRKTCGYHHWIDPTADHECISQTFGHSSTSLTKRFLGITKGKTAERAGKVIELDEETLLRDRQSPLCQKAPPDNPFPSEVSWLSIMNLITARNSEMIRLTDKYGINVYASPSHFEHMGYTAEERIGKLGLDITHPDDIDVLMATLHELGKNPEDYQALLKYRVKHAEGHYIWLETYFTYIQDSDGAMKNLFQSSRVVPEQKKAEGKLVKKSKHQYFPPREVMGFSAKSKKPQIQRQKVPDSMVPGDKTDMIRIVDLEGRNIYVSPSHFEAAGYTPEERIGKNVTESIHPDDMAVIMDTMTVAQDEPVDGKNAICVNRIKHKDGHYFWVETLSEYVRDPDGSISAIMQFSRIVSPRKKAAGWLTDLKMKHIPRVVHEVIEWDEDRRLKLLNIRNK